MKKLFIAPEFEIVVVEDIDIVTSSCNENEEIECPSNCKKDDSEW